MKSVHGFYTTTIFTVTTAKLRGALRLCAQGVVRFGNLTVAKAALRDVNDDYLPLDCDKFESCGHCASERSIPFRY